MKLAPFTSMFAALAAVALLGGCQLIAGIKSRSTDPPPQANSCSLPSLATHPTWGGQVRFVNLGTSAPDGVPTEVDFCVRPSGTTDWGRPIFRDGGLDYPDAGVADAGHLCSRGLPYAHGTVPVSVPVGSVDILAIRAGLTCTSPGAKSSEVDGVSVSASSSASPAVVTVVRYGGGEKTPESLVTLPEEPGTVSNVSNHLRAVNALNDPTQSVNFGVASGTTLPTNVPTPLFMAPVPPGHAAPPQTNQFGVVDAEGYQAFIQGTVSLGFTNASDPTNEAFAVVTEGTTSGVDTGTFYAIGDRLDLTNTFPVRGLFCEDRLGPLDGGVASESALFQRCTETTFTSISVDSWDVSLYGANSPFADQRIGPLASYIGQRTGTDVFCVTEADDAASRAQIIAAAQAAGLVYSYEATSDESTPATDPLTADGGTPPAPSAPACGSALAAQVNEAYSCGESKCANASGAIQGSTDCLEQNCLTQFLPLYHPVQTSPMDTVLDVCFDCIVLNLLDATETYAAGQKACEKTVAPSFGFGGQTPLIILSRYKLSHTATYFYPSSGLRRAMLKAEVTLDAQTSVDFFCTQLISPQIDSELPYVGPYGKDLIVNQMQVSNGWEQEQLLQAQRAVGWIQAQAKADHLPAIIAGTFYSTVAHGMTDGGDLGLSSISPEIMQTLDATQGGAFTRAEPPSYVRACDACPDNPYTLGSPAFEFSPLFLYDYPGGASATTSETLFANDPASYIPIQSEGGETAPTSGKGPLSVYYGHNTVLVRPTH